MLTNENDRKDILVLLSFFSAYDKDMKRLLCFILCLIVSCGLCLTGCVSRPSPQDALTLFSAKHPLPDGRMYFSGSEPYSDTYLSPARFDLLYARPDGGTDREDIQGFALFFGSSPRVIYEMGIFSCLDRDAAFEVAGMLRGRVDIIRRMTEADTSYAEDAVIELYGSTVIYLILPDNPAAARTLARILS